MPGFCRYTLVEDSFEYPGFSYNSGWAAAADSLNICELMQLMQQTRGAKGLEHIPSRCSKI